MIRYEKCAASIGGASLESDMALRGLQRRSEYAYDGQQMECLMNTGLR